MMSAKTNLEYNSNSYNGGTMGSDSPAALLDMLAEVASQTLHSEKKHSKSLLASQYKTKIDCVKRKSNESCFNMPQLLSMPASQLVKQFSIFTSDELKRQYSYTCALVDGCNQKYTSFASEGRARMSIKAHLAEHLEDLKNNKDTYKNFTVKSIHCKSYKALSQSKRSKLQQLRKPQETLNKENKDVVTEKSSNYLRNILLNDSTFKELDKNKGIAKANNLVKIQNIEQKDADQLDFKVLGDHSYFERLKDEMPCKKETFNDGFANATDENIVLMVVGTDSIHMKEYPYINTKLSEETKHTSEAIYLQELSWSAKSRDKAVDATISKPKGKAKFIGTSKEEKEMALAFMDRIKKKGNPVGNNLECRICNPPRSFTAPTTLVSHYRSHAGIKPYECRICRAVFTRRHSLKYHMLIHQNQTRFTCSDCGKKFRHPSHFREHRRRHTGEAPFGCDDCGQRFKTRNTYKRHLKTRHGKILTTTGELLYLSEEDFQKVRTNKKKKINVYKDQTIDEDIIAAKGIMHYSNDNVHLQNTVGKEYILNGDIPGTDINLQSNNVRHIVKRCFETCEISPESHIDKTECIQTEISVDDNNHGSSKHENCLSDEYINEIEGEITLLQDPPCNKLEVIEHEKNTVTNHNNPGSHEIIYHNIRETPSYIQIAYNNVISVTEANCNLEYEETSKLSDQNKNQIEIIEETEGDYFNSLSNAVNGQKYIHDIKEEGTKLTELNTDVEMRNENIDKHVIYTQAFMENLIKNREYSSYEGAKPLEFIASEDFVSSSDSQDVTNNVLSTITDTVMNQNESSVLEDHSQVGNCHTVVTNSVKNPVITSTNCILEKDRNSLKQPEQHLYVHNKPITSIVVQNKCINILPQHFKIFNDQQGKLKIQLNKSKVYTLANKHTQSINNKQSLCENAMLLITNNILKNNVFNVGQHDNRDNEIAEK